MIQKTAKGIKNQHVIFDALLDSIYPYFPNYRFPALISSMIWR